MVSEKYYFFYSTVGQLFIKLSFIGMLTQTQKALTASSTTNVQASATTVRVGRNAC